LDPASFSQTSEMERMVQMGTGAMDTATPLAGNRRNETATGSSLIAGTFVKRSKRALRSITNSFLNPLVQKILWRRMDYDKENYPQDYQFRIASTLGIVAREIEQNQITGLLQYAQNKPQTQNVLMKAIFDNSSSPYKAEIENALKADTQPDPMQQQLQALQMKGAELEIAAKEAEVNLKHQDAIKRSIESKKLESEIFVNFGKLQEMQANGSIKSQELQLETARLLKELEEVKQFARQVDVSMIKVLQDANRPQGGNSGESAASD